MKVGLRSGRGDTSATPTTATPISISSTAATPPASRSPCPQQRGVYNTPLVSREELSYDFGIYGQDQWTFKRLTVNAGLRWEWVNAKVPAQTSPAGRFVPARSYPETPDVPNQSDPAPRFGLAYDLFGTGKTAVKFSINRYNASRTTGDAPRRARSATTRWRATSSTLTWTDLNGDDIAQGERGCIYLTAGCEIQFRSAICRRIFGFGTRALTTQDPDIKRTWDLETGVEIQHELFPRDVGDGWRTITALPQPAAERQPQHLAGGLDRR